MDYAARPRLERELDSIREQGLYKTERVITTPQSAEIRTTDGREVLNFCANNYLGLADNPDIIGFVWFDHSVAGTDWRIESSDAASEEFATGVADTRYRAGVIRPPKPGT